MATAETVDLGPPHEPKEESIKAFKEVEHELKKQLVHLRHQYNKHEPEYFAAVSDLSDSDLTSFTDADFDLVRVATSAYGLHLLGRVRLPAIRGADSGAPAYIHFRIFSPGPDEPASLHSIHTEEKEQPGHGFTYRAIFTKNDPLEWFST
ncbi:hypothetical protein VTK73DRAFT_7646 [Phialemonium thermophilum]|uniref:Uncharacterized protein n=1 Tax=Phialemonium thermophilum TaxID=223376 RepID=A0ABR3Y7V1_9PEZI